MSLDFTIVDVFSDRAFGGNQLAVFTDADGISDATATGSAGAALVASLAGEAPLADGGCSIRIDQGVSMGRPSLIEAAARKEHGRLTEVSVGGHATIVGRGVMTLD